MKRIVLTLAVSMVLFSCKKDDKETPSSCEVSAKGLSGSYKLTALVYKKSASATPVDYLAGMEPCQKDDILVLKADGTYDYPDTGITCSPDESASGTFEVKGNTLTSDGILNGTVASYDCKTLVYYAENTLEAGDRMTFTLVKQ